MAAAVSMDDVSNNGGTMSSASGTVHADYHTFWILDRTLPEVIGEYRTPLNGIAAQTIPGAVLITTGISTGSVNLEVATLHTPPEIIDLGDWDEVVELSIDAPGDHLMVTSLFTHLPIEFPNLAPDGPGSYRLRVHAKGRDTAVGLVESGVENYRLWTWPAPTGAERVLKATDHYGATVRAQAPLDI